MFTNCVAIRYGAALLDIQNIKIGGYNVGGSHSLLRFYKAKSVHRQSPFQNLNDAIDYICKVGAPFHGQS